VRNALLPLAKQPQPRSAASITAMSIFVMCIMASAGDAGWIPSL
jgi:hypothetical protein